MAVSVSTADGSTADQLASGSRESWETLRDAAVASALLVGVILN